jgi:gliding motility-associated-like protein
VKEHKDIEQLFKDSFDHFEAPVRHELWSAVSQQLPGAVQSAASASSGLSVLTKTIIGLSAVGVIATATYLSVSDNDTVPVAQVEVPVQNTQEVEEVVIETVEQENVSNESSEPLRVSESNSVEVQTTNAVGRNEVNETNTHAQRTVETKIDATTESRQNIPVHKEPVRVKENTDQVPPVPVSKTESSQQAEVLRAPDKEVDPVLVVDQQTAYLPEKLPNTFTPNGDGVNDFLQFDVNGLTQFRIEVYSAKGELIYVSQDAMFRWDGLKMDGTPAPNGRYVYQVEGKDENGNPIKPRVQSLQLIR